MDYRETKTAPEDKEVRVIWGKIAKPEHGSAIRLGDEWYITSEPNPHANGRPCATPCGWLPLDHSEYTEAEERALGMVI